jgi:hypothetical protein
VVEAKDVCFNLLSAAGRDIELMLDLNLSRRTSSRTSDNVAESMMAPPLTATISPAVMATRAKSPRPWIGLARFSVLELNQLLIDVSLLIACAHNPID